MLMAYIFDIKYRSTAAHGKADALSRFPVGMDPDFDKEVNADTIRKHLSTDETTYQHLSTTSLLIHRYESCNISISTSRSYTETLA